MPKRAKRLTDREVANLKTPGFYAVGLVPGVYLQVVSPTLRSWVLYSVMNGRRRKMGLGSYPETTLEKAREKALEMRQQARDGIDPIENRRAEKKREKEDEKKKTTFQQATELYLKDNEQQWKNAKHRQQWENTLTTYAYPKIGNKAVSQISREHVARILRPIWNTKTETATRVRQRIHTVLDWCIVSEMIEGENPALWAGRLDKLFPAPTKIKQVTHHPALPYEEVGEFVNELKERNGHTHRALLFLALTATRSSETRGATWSEFNLDKKTWTIPGSRMKAGVAHTVPLSRQALSLLEAQRGLNRKYAFPSPMGKELSDSGLSKAMRSMELNAVPHGLRSTFRTWASEETDHDNNALEKALAHTIDSKVEAAYRRGDLLEKRVTIMQEWADYLDGGDRDER